MEFLKIAVIGAGPAGIAVGVEAAQAGITGTVILEKAARPCNTIVRLYRQGKEVHSVYRNVLVAPQGKLSFQTQSREAFLDWMDEVIAEHRLDIQCSCEVQEIRKEGELFKLFRGNNTALEAAVVVVCIGVFDRPVRPSYRIPEEIKKQVYYTLPEVPLSGQKVLVVGGGDSAAEAACFLSAQNQVTLSYRRQEFFRINEQNLCSLNQCCHVENLALRLGVDITALAPDAKGIGVSYSDGVGEYYDAIFYFLGGTTPEAFLKKAGVVYQEKKPVVDAHGESTVPGLFLAGDLTADKGTIMSAFNSGAAVIKKILQSYPHLVN